MRIYSQMSLQYAERQVDTSMGCNYHLQSHWKHVT